MALHTGGALNFAKFLPNLAFSTTSLESKMHILGYQFAGSGTQLTASFEVLANSD